MRDQTGREIDYMRISITDRCNLRCKYCMPDGIQCMPRWEILSLEELEAIAVCAADLGIRKIKVTGGEPLVRRDCPQLVRMLKNVPGIEKVTLTTNGVLLEQYLGELLNAGLDAVNISLDTLDAGLYETITGADALDKVLGIISRADRLPIPVKVNAVSIDFDNWKDGKERDKNGWRAMAALAEQYPVDVRFIEMMPIGYGKQFQGIDHRTLLLQLKEMYPDLETDHEVHGFGPAVYYKSQRFKGSIGLISAIHGKFCSSCNRVRLTAQGYLKNCLCYEDGVDLKQVLRGEISRPEKESHFIWPEGLDVRDEGLQSRLRTVMEKTILKKPMAHCFETPGRITESHNMSSIGG